MRTLFTTIATLLLLAIVPSVIAQPKPPLADLPPNTWVKLHKDDVGARRGCAIRFATAADAFFLWGFMDFDSEFLQESSAMNAPEYDVIAFDLAANRWKNHLPKRWEEEWSKKLPPAFVPRCYHALTSGSERSLFRPPANYPDEAARPDLNICFDQVVYHPPTKSLIYFTGGLTVAYNVEARRWTNLAPAHSPPPVLGGSLVHDPIHDELILFGGGHVAEEGPGGRIVGYTGTWAYSFADKDWRRLKLDRQPPPRMYSRIVCDPKSQMLMLFGGDSQSHYLADTWLFDLKTRSWRPSQAEGGPPARAGHFTVFDPDTGWCFIGGGHQSDDLRDLWAYDLPKERWYRLKGEVPTGAYISADLDPKQRVMLLVANEQAANHGRSCDVLYANRTTYAYRLDTNRFTVFPERAQPQQSVPKRPASESGRSLKPDPEKVKAHNEKLKKLPTNEWIALENPARTAQVRSWGSAAFDSDRGRIIYWGGGHCSYGGSEVDMYDVAAHTWISGTDTPEYPHRMWARGVRLAGVSFDGNPWTEHGRRIYAYDPTGRKLLMVRSITLTTGYEPEPLRAFPGEPRARVDAKVKPPTSYSKYATWSFDPDAGKWEIVAPAPVGLDTLVTTKHGVAGVNVDWPARLNDAGYLVPWNAERPVIDNAVHLFDSTKKSWKRLGDKQPSPTPSPQNLYEMTSLAYDSKRDQLLLHGGGLLRDELWSFSFKTNEWKNLKPTVAVPPQVAPPVAHREIVYLPNEDVLVTFGPNTGKVRLPAFWVYSFADNAWRQMGIDSPPGIDARNAAGQNRAMAYDPARNLILLVLASNDRSEARVYALRYRHDVAKEK